MSLNKPTIFSGIQPTGNLHLGNYLGAISQWVKMQENYNPIFCVVDYHAITVKQEPAELQKNIKEIAKIYIAAGINPAKSIIFQQSEVSAHTELAWILNCAARMGDLNKMTQFKDKSGENQETSNIGLYAYPVLQAADILLYDTDIVPIGEDQFQHIELARNLARRFNKQFGEVFKIPKAQIQKHGARVMGLDDPEKKMSKSAKNPANYIALNEKIKAAKKKITRAVTDSDNKIFYNKEEKPAISNLLTIYALLDNISIEALVAKYKNSGYGDFKQDLAEVVGRFLENFQNKLNKISNKDIEKVLQKGKNSARLLADKKLQAVKRKLGIN